MWTRWNKGDERDYSFEIEISDDGNNFEKVFEVANDNESTEQEIYPFDPEVNGKYIKLTIMTQVQMMAGLAYRK